MLEYEFPRVARERDDAGDRRLALRHRTPDRCHRVAPNTAIFHVMHPAIATPRSSQKFASSADILRESVVE
jgi:hypothetical protein